MPLAASLLVSSAIAQQDLTLKLTKIVPASAGFGVTTFVTSYPNTPRWLVIVEQHEARLRVRDVRNPLLPITPVTGDVLLNLSDRVITTGQDQLGILGFAFDPQFRTNPDCRFIYVLYTSMEDPAQGIAMGQGVIERFNVPVGSRFRADPDGEIIWKDPDTTGPFMSVHSYGNIDFGPTDGRLYIPVGDHTDPLNGTVGQQERAQSLNSTRGKILRINKDGSIPDDNPFYTGQDELQDSIWALGCRNPFTLRFDSGTGDLWFGDVGDAEFEEVNRDSSTASALRNFGWPCFEGEFGDGTSSCNPVPHTTPYHEYARDALGDPCNVLDGNAITGGYVYRGSDYFFTDPNEPEETPQERYFFGDFQTNQIFTIPSRVAPPVAGTMRIDHTAELGVCSLINPNDQESLIGFGEDSAGEILVVFAKVNPNPGSDAPPFVSEIYRIEAQ